MEILASFRPYWGDLAAIGSALTWAVAIIFFQLAGLRMSTIALNLFKNGLGFILVFITLLFMNVPLLPELSGEAWLKIVVSAVLGLTIADVLLLASLKRLGAGMQAVVDCSYAPSIMLVAFFLYSEVLPLEDLLGGALVLIAVLIGARDPEMSNRGKALPAGIAMGVSSHVLMGFGILMLKDLFHQVSLLWLVGVRLLIGQVFLILYCIVRGRTDYLRESLKPKGAFVHISLATVLGSYIAIYLWTAGFKYTLAGRAAIYNQLSSIFIIVLAWLVLREKFTKHRIVAVLLAIGGAFLVSA